MRVKEGFTLVEIMIVLVIICLVATLAIPNLIKAQISANDALAKTTLRDLSLAAERYSTDNSSNYPTDITSLTEATPPYINEEYCGDTISGFTYACNFATDSYTFTATPVSEGATGTTTYTITTGSVLSP